MRRAVVVVMAIALGVMASLAIAAEDKTPLKTSGSVFLAVPHGTSIAYRSMEVEYWTVKDDKRETKFFSKQVTPKWDANRHGMAAAVSGNLDMAALDGLAKNGKVELPVVVVVKLRASIDEKAEATYEYQTSGGKMKLPLKNDVTFKELVVAMKK